MSGISTLDPENFPQRPDRTVGKGHGTDALGPSDSSDSGSDIVGGPGFGRGPDGDAPPTEDDARAHPEDWRASGEAGPDLGDANLDSDTDSGGTGERAMAGRDTVVRDGVDIDTDHIETLSDDLLSEDDIAFLASSPPGSPAARSAK
jgi:hypothetical protein